MWEDHQSPPPLPGKLKRQIVTAAIVALVSIGASAASCVGQSFARRQALALEAIQRELEGRCAR